MLLDKLIRQIRFRKNPERRESELHSRSFIKAISWRFIGTLDTILIAWLISGNVSIAFSIGTLELATKTLLYYFHERLWGRIPWGK